VFQFALSAALIFGTGILYQQLAYVQEKQLGFDREQVVTIPLKRPSVAKQAGALKQEVARLAGVRSVSKSLGAPFGEGFGTVGMVLDTETGTVDLHRAQVDDTFLETLDISVVAGRPLTAEDVTENASVCLLNRTATEALGWDAPRAAIGAEVGFSGRECRVVGVVADFHFRPLYRPIEPLRLEPVQQPRTLTVRLAPEDVPGTIDRLRRTWNDIAAPLPFTVDFLDQRVAESYRQEQRTATLLGSFAGLAILLACLGLLGLSAYAAARRTKEIGVRKVLGATTTNIVTLLSKGFLVLVGVACLIAAPVAYVGAQRWLQNFAYRIEISPLLFLGVSAGTVLLALATIGYQALRAAQLDPAITLRNE
jgi:putative ABC transport system permease protein